MIHLSTVALWLTLANPGQPVLLDFHADWCQPCRSMEPTIRRLVADGYVIRKVNVDREPQLARDYGVTAVPTFVALSAGNEVGRIVGPTSFEGLVRLVGETAGRASPAATARAGAGSPAPAAAPIAPSAAASGGNSLTPEQRAMQATVRLRVIDSTGNSFGTGTVIDFRNGEALVMTCGHIFRESQGKGAIEADLFVPGARNPTPGVLISYDLERDVALLAIQPGVPITPAPVATAGAAVQPGDRVFTVGCDRGHEPTLKSSQVTAVNKYQMPDNFVVAGAPVIGRSGGGLFSAPGELIGVCNLANNADDEGIYAAVSLLHHSLDQAQLSWIYRPAGAQVASAPQTSTPPAARAAAPGASAPASPPEMPSAMPFTVPLEGAAQASRDRLTAAAPAPFDLPSDDSEIFILVRPRENPQATQLIRLASPSRELREWLASESRRAAETAEPVLLATQPDGRSQTPPRDNRVWSETTRAQSPQ